jgi:3-deoxy-D-arabino-heptulosonate 7-phosphate (DAHP) synthase
VVVQNQREVSEQPRLKSIFDDEKGAHEIYAISEFGIDETSKKIAEELKEKGGKIRITGVYKGKTNIYKLEVIT